MKNSFLLLLTFLLNSCLPAQHLNKVVIPKFSDSKGDSVFSVYAYQYLDKNHKEFYGLCSVGCSFAKFQISKTGKITNVRVSKNTNDIIRSGLVKMILSSEGLWTPMQVNGVRVDSKDIVLPFMYSFDLKCKDSFESLTNDRTFFNFGFMIDFEGDESRSSYLDCIILRPLTWGMVE